METDRLVRQTAVRQSDTVPDPMSVTIRVGRFLVILGLLLCLFSVSAFSFMFERRRDQFIDTPGYLILPVPYSYPGIGTGLVLVGYAGNMFETQTDAILLGFNGDAEGYYLLVNEIFLVDRFFFLNASHMGISKFGVTMYSSRGMDTDQEDYNTFVGDKYQQSQVRANMTLLDRRLEFWYQMDDWAARATDIYDPDENLIRHYDNPDEMGARETTYGVQLDLTDDRTDPRSGIRLKQISTRHPADADDEPDYDILTRSATLYIPILEDSTWVFHYTRSDATVRREGNTDITAIAIEKGIGFCPYLADQQGCEAAILSDAQNTAAANKYGSSLSLGGAYRLRSYPEGRYKGAHTELRGTEFRWNFNTKNSKIDLYFLKDIVHAFQLAFFWEEGSVSETEAELGKITRSSYGGGFRFVAESGNVYRLDWATGEEGSQLTMLFQYPWGESD
ncbi:MAG: hypothetical protein ABIK68_01770 [bacterium]